MGWLLAFVLLSVLILFHEFGHFLLAKINGVEVEEFSLGFGPRLFSVVKGGTRYSLKLLFFGGACVMKGMVQDEEDADGDNDASASDEDNQVSEGIGRHDQRRHLTKGDGSFQSVSLGGRASIVVAGPLFNFILAFIGAIIVISLVGYDPSTVLYVDPESSAAEAGLQEGDLITGFNGHPIVIGRDMTAELMFHEPEAGKTIEMKISRDGQSQVISFTPDTYELYRMGISYAVGDGVAEVLSVVEGSPIANAGITAGDIILEVNDEPIASGDALNAYFESHPLDGSELKMVYLHGNKERTAYLTPVMTPVTEIGFQYNLYREKTGSLATIKYSAYEVWYWIRTTVQSVGRLFSGQGSLDDLSGPVGVADLVEDTYEDAKPAGTGMVFLNLLNLLVFLSADLGVMNLLPIPGVDGGRLLFIIIEAVRRKPVDRKIQGTIELITVMLLLALMMLVLYNDILRLF